MARLPTSGRRTRRRPETPAAPAVPEQQPSVAPENLSPPSTGPEIVPVPPAPSFRWPWYFLSVFIPFAGVVVGLFLYEHESAAVRRIGRNSLLIGFVVWVLFPTVLFLLSSLLIAVAAMDWIANLLPPGS